MKLKLANYKNSSKSNYELKNAEICKSGELSKLNRMTDLTTLESLRKNKDTLHVSRNGLDKICAVTGRNCYN